MTILQDNCKNVIVNKKIKTGQDHKHDIQCPITDHHTSMVYHQNVNWPLTIHTNYKGL